MIRLSQCNYSAINHHIEQKKFLSTTLEHLSMRGKYYFSQLSKEFMGSLYIL